MVGVRLNLNYAKPLPTYRRRRDRRPRKPKAATKPRLAGSGTGPLLMVTLSTRPVPVVATVPPLIDVVELSTNRNAIVAGAEPSVTPVLNVLVVTAVVAFQVLSGTE